MFEGLFQPMHMLIILAIVLVIFGPGKLGDIGGSLGKAIRGFKREMNSPDKPADEITKADQKSQKDQ